MSRKLLFIAHLILLAFLIAIALITDGVGNEGDSLTHFFMAQKSWDEPDYLFDLWGKPFFTLWASPWAQLGFKGIKVFNILCGLATSYITCLLAKELKKNWYWAILPIAFIAPAYFTYLYSGLTEPFSALVAVLSVWLIYTKRVSWGFILASFLPFCRSEAQLYLLFFGLYALLNRHWKELPLLFTGYIAYTLIGGIYLGDFAWIFDIPYKADNSFYGSGEWFHYLDHLTFMIGGVQLLLLGLGLIQMVVKLIQGRMNWKREPLLVHCLFFFLLLAHTIVWKLGSYGSAGLSRVLILGFPFMWLIILDGVELLAELSGKLLVRKKWILPSLTVILHLTAILNQPKTFSFFRKNVLLSVEKKAFKEEVAPFIRQSFPQADYFIFDHPYIAMALKIDFMKKLQHNDWRVFNDLEQLPEGTLLIWEEVIAGRQYGIDPEKLAGKDNIKEIQSWQGKGWAYKLFEKI